jgi:hypothetical protein
LGKRAQERINRVDTGVDVARVREPGGNREIQSARSAETSDKVHNKNLQGDHSTYEYQNHLIGLEESSPSQVESTSFHPQLGATSSQGSVTIP